LGIPARENYNNRAQHGTPLKCCTFQKCFLS
jgi:hypothetical protein